VDSSTAGRRRTRALIALFGMAAAAVVGLVNGLASCSPRARPPDKGRPVSMAEAQRLAAVRLHDQQDGHSGFRATVGAPGAAVHLTGWVDWRRPLLYLGSVGDRPGPADGLVQAVPDLVAARLGRLGSADDPYPGPPAQPPTEGWRVRRLSPDSPAGSPLDSLFALLLGLHATGPDDAGALVAGGARFLRRDLLGGVPVDVVAGPAVLPTPVMGPRLAPRPSPSGAPVTGQVTYWLDDGGRLRRLDAYLRKDLPVRVDFSRDDPGVPAAIAPLGGAAVAPRPVTAAEAGLLARMVVRDRSARGGRLTIQVPVSPAGILRADGWLDWRATTAYLAARNPDDPSQDTLVWADRTGVGTHPLSGAAPVAADGVPASPRPTPSAVPTSPPPAQPPAGGWRMTTWAQHDTEGSSDLDVLLGAALAATGPAAGDPAPLRKRASWLREDTLAGVPVTVFEIRGLAETGTAPGDGLLRYWVDRSGLLRRIEVRTGDRAYGYLDVSAGPVPALSPPR
jgi:hypothetical protein